MAVATSTATTNVHERLARVFGGSACVPHSTNGITTVQPKVAHSQQLDSEDDAVLVLRVGEGDAGAYRELVQRHAAKLRYFALRLTRDADDADDVVQETFLRLWQRARDYSPSARPSAWLHRIAHNLAIDRLRARGHLQLLDDAEPAPESAGQHVLLENKRRMEALDRALAELPPRQAAALVLVHLQGMSGKDAAYALGVGTEALESLLSRARRRLKALLTDRFGTSPENGYDREKADSNAI